MKDKYIVDEDAYRDFVMNTGIFRAGRGLKQLKKHDEDELHMALGLSSEIGELVGAYKKAYAYNQPLDVDNVIEELGDILFYLTGLATLHGRTMEGLRKENSSKLLVRYPDGYSHEAAKERKDKKNDRERTRQ